MLTTGRPPAPAFHMLGHPGQQPEPPGPRVLSRGGRSQTRCPHGTVIGSTGGAPALPVVPAAPNRASPRSQDPQDGADDQQDDPNRHEDPDIGDEADDEQDQPENDHAAASSGPTSTRPAPRTLADRTLIVPTPNCQSARLHEANGVGEPRRSGGSLLWSAQQEGLETRDRERRVPRSRGQVGQPDGQWSLNATCPFPRASEKRRRGRGAPGPSEACGRAGRDRPERTTKGSTMIDHERGAARSICQQSGRVAVGTGGCPRLPRTALRSVGDGPDRAEQP
jgi:hypothetical protein